MPKQVRVMLLEDVDTLGKAGSIVTVAEGYARNFLFPSGKAALATQEREQHLQQRQKKAEQEQEVQLAAAQELAAALDGTELTLEAKVKEGDEIFGSISASQIAKELNQQAGLALKASDVELADPIRKLGEYGVVVHLSPEIDTKIQVTVVPDAASKKTQEVDDEE